MFFPCKNKSLRGFSLAKKSFTDTVSLAKIKLGGTVSFATKKDLTGTVSLPKRAYG